MSKKSTKMTPLLCEFLQKKVLTKGREGDILSESPPREGVKEKEFKKVKKST